MNKYVLRIFAIAALIVFPMNQIHAEEWSPMTIGESIGVVNIQGIGEMNIDSLGYEGSLLQYNRPTSVGSVPEKCSAFGISPCTQANLSRLQAGFTMPICSANVIDWCIKSLEAHPINENANKLTFVRYIHANTYPGDPSIKLPEGGSMSLWKYESSGESPALYFAANISGWGIWNSGRPFFQQTTGSIYAVELNESNQYVEPKYMDHGNGPVRTGYGPVCQRVIFIENGICASAISIPTNIVFSLEFIVPNEIGGFFASRTSSTRMSINQVSSESKLVHFEGSALRIPRFSAVLTPALVEYLMPNKPANVRSSFISTDARQDGATLNLIDKLRSLTGDRLTGYSTAWSFTTLAGSANEYQKGMDSNNNPRMNYASYCKIPNSELLGLVTSNAMVIDPGPPNFVGDSFRYSVAGMHYQPDGVTLERGYYLLLISKSLTSCLYKMPEVPIRAAVSIVHEGDSETVVTTSTVIDSGQYYVVEISGFTFSRPEIQIKFEYSEKAAPTTSPSNGSVDLSVPSNPPKQNKKIIKCVKGKSTKMISGNSPKCPNGYKKLQ